MDTLVLTRFFKMKNRLLLAVVALVALTCAPPLAAQTARTNEASLLGRVLQGYAGRTVNVPWGLRHTGTVSGIQFDLSYPANKLNAGIFQPGALSNNVAFHWRQIAPGQQRVLLYTKDGSALGTNLPIGNLPMTIPAEDYTGGGGRIEITNAIVSRTNAVAALPLRLAHGGVFSTAIFRGSDAVVDVLLFVQSNHLWVVQASTNLLDWVNIATNFATLDYVAATDEDAPNFPMRFYRAALVGSASGGQISGLSLQSGGNLLTFGYATTAGRTYVLQSSTNLTSWTAMTTNVASGSLLNFTNLISPTLPQQFFRVLESP